jgi:hypothetical protein
VGEVINGEIRLLGINGGIRLLGINEGDLREENKKEEEDLEEASYFCFRISEFRRGRGGGGNWRNVVFFWKLS